VITLGLTFGTKPGKSRAIKTPPVIPAAKTIRCKTTLNIFLIAGRLRFLVYHISSSAISV
jgi:hypothetical protein